MARVTQVRDGERAHQSLANKAFRIVAQSSIFRAHAPVDETLNDDIRNSASFKKDEVLQPGANVRLFGTLAY